MKKKIILILTVILSFAMLISNTACETGPEGVPMGDFLCAVRTDLDGEKQIIIMGLSEEGQTKKVIVVPEEIDGIPVTQIGVKVNDGMWGDGYDGKWGSDVLERVYIGTKNLNIVAVNFLNPTPRLKKSLMWNGTTRLKINQDKQISVRKANVLYHLNYGELDGTYYWIDDYDNEKISFIPPNPTREGYTFGGWYKEPECINEWNFDVDIVPDGIVEYVPVVYNYSYTYVCTNQTNLYAKWIAN